MAKDAKGATAVKEPKVAKEKKVTNASAILVALLEGASSIAEIAQRAATALGHANPKKLENQVKGLLNNIKKGSSKKWTAYKVSEIEGTVKVEKIA